MHPSATNMIVTYEACPPREAVITVSHEGRLHSPNRLLSHRSTAPCTHGPHLDPRLRPGVQGSHRGLQRADAGVLVDLLRRRWTLQAVRTAVGLLAPLRCKSPVCPNHRQA